MINIDSTKEDSEKRQHERVEFLTSIRVIIDTVDDSQENKKVDIKGDSKDLSLKGVFIITKEKVPTGSPCSVSIFLSGTKEDIKLQIQGVVARIENTGLGIAFDSMDVDSFAHLKSIVKYNSGNN